VTEANHASPVPTGSELLCFGVFELEPRSGELRKRGARVRLQEKPRRILELLLRQPGQAVTRDELRATLWPANVFVDFDHNLNSAMTKLRDALGDSAASPRFIETLPRGYRFIAPVSVGQPVSSSSSVHNARAEPAAAEPTPARTRGWWVAPSALVAVAALLCVVSIVVVQTRRLGAAASTRAVNPDVYEAYSKGRYFLDKSPGGLQKGISYFQQAIAMDATYAPAFAGLADAYGQLGWGLSSVTPPTEAYPKALAAANRALELDERLAAAHVALARIRWKYEWNWRAAEEELRRGIELDPDSMAAHESYFDFLSALGRHSEALVELRRAASLDPVSLTINYDFGLHFARTGEFALAVERLKQAIDLDPTSGFVHHVLGELYAERGMFPDAVAELQRALDLSGTVPHFVAALASVRGMSGDRDAAVSGLASIQALARRQYVSQYDRALLYASIGRHEEALTSLERAYEERDPWLSMIRVQPRMEVLAGEPRFQAILQRIGLAARIADARLTSVSPRSASVPRPVQ
jgi:tetratricopeptide (TPR) repeat protein